MCLGIPGRIVEIADAGRKLATVEISGVRRQVNVACIADDGALDDLVGCWALIHVGFAMSRIDEAEAAADARHPARTRRGSGRDRGDARERAHAGGGAMKFTDEFRDPRAAKGVLAAIARATDAIGASAEHPVHIMEILRRPHPRDLSLWPRQADAAGAGVHPRARLPGLRAADEPGRRGGGAGRAAGRDLHHLRRRHAGTRHAEVAAAGQGRRRRRAHGLFAARRAGPRPTPPRPRGDLLRPRLRDHDAFDRADHHAGDGGRADQLHGVLQPHHRTAADQGAARRPADDPRRLRRAWARLDGDRHAALRFHRAGLRQAHRGGGLRAAGPAAIGADGAGTAPRRPRRGGEPVFAGGARGRQSGLDRRLRGSLRAAEELRVAGTRRDRPVGAEDPRQDMPPSMRRRSSGSAMAPDHGASRSPRAAPAAR